MTNPIVKRNSGEGFTLIEVLTAIMILAVSLVVIFQLFSQGLKSAEVSGKYTRAIFHARAKMEEVLLIERLREGESEGIYEDGYRWKLIVAPANSQEDLEDGLKFLANLFYVTLDVIWNSGEHERTFTIHTLHIAERIETDENA